ncbi:MAG: tyrosine-type recombinase/integrase [Nodosilinea sp. WJT8-NPBG4]|nr:tyrosine-type recombinase/integrase [Nodosilinea sp. WJT8-NPBG4]
MLGHSCGYHLAEQGMPTRDIQVYLGHKNIQHTVRYTAANLGGSTRFSGSRSINQTKSCKFVLTQKTN